MSPYIIEACRVEDAVEIARSNISAFWNDPNWVLMWRDKSKDYVISQAIRRSARNLLKDPTQYRHQKVQDCDTGAIVGYARWILPTGSDIGVWNEAIVPRVSQQEVDAAEKEFQDADWSTWRAVDELDPPIDAMNEALLSRKEYVILSYLAVHPNYQRKGIASLLVDSGIKAAQNMNFDIFVRASDAGLRMYQKVGFQLLGQVIQDDSRFGGNGNYGVHFLEKNCS